MQAGRMMVPSLKRLSRTAFTAGPRVLLPVACRVPARAAGFHRPLTTASPALRAAANAGAEAEDEAEEVEDAEEADAELQPEAVVSAAEAEGMSVAALQTLRGTLKRRVMRARRKTSLMRKKVRKKQRMAHIRPRVQSWVEQITVLEVELVQRRASGEIPSVQRMFRTLPEEIALPHPSEYPEYKQ